MKKCFVLWCKFANGNHKFILGIYKNEKDAIREKNYREKQDVKNDEDFEYYIVEMELKWITLFNFMEKIK